MTGTKSYKIENPRNNLTLVTINYKNYAGLEKTLQSIAEQVKDEAIELVIVDGGSCDLSHALIKSFSCANISLKWISERDAGIYDAMNKGLNLSTSEFVAYLNSGDCLNSKDTLRLLLEKLHSDKSIDFLYSNVSFVNKVGGITRLWTSGKFHWFKILFGWMPPHPMTIIRRSKLIEIGGFDLEFSIASDYDLMLRILKSKKLNIDYVNFTSVKMEAGGVSNGSLNNILRANFEVLLAWKKMYGWVVPYWIVFTKPLSKLVQLKGRLR